MKRLLNALNLWKNGSQVQATHIVLVSIFDNLIDAATFKYDLFNVTEDPPLEEGGEPVLVKTHLESGTLQMNPAEYAAWGQDEYINTAAYNWAAGKLNLDINWESSQ